MQRAAESNEYLYIKSIHKRQRMAPDATDNESGVRKYLLKMLTTTQWSYIHIFYTTLFQYALSYGGYRVCGTGMGNESVSPPVCWCGLLVCSECLSMPRAHTQNIVVALAHIAYALYVVHGPWAYSAEWCAIENYTRNVHEKWSRAPIVSKSAIFIFVSRDLSFPRAMRNVWEFFWPILCVKSRLLNSQQDIAIDMLYMCQRWTLHDWPSLPRSTGVTNFQ